MILSADLFDRVLLSLAKQKGDDDERRSHPRIGLWASIHFFAVDGKDSRAVMKARIRDISAGGVNLLTRSMLAPGTQFYLDLPRGEETPLRLLFRVKHCREVGQGLFSLGSELVKRLAAPRTAFQAAPSTAPQSARRQSRSPRRAKPADGTLRGRDAAAQEARVRRAILE